MMLYIVKSSLCLFLLWAFYALFLEKENIHFVKRYYLLFSLVFACILPLITFTYEVEVVAQPEVVSEILTPIAVVPDIEIMEETTNYSWIILWSIYGIGVLIFGFRFIRNITDISKKIQQNDRYKEQSHVNVLVGNTIVPHTFLKYIFVPKRAFQQKNIPTEVLLHEKTHVLQKHTLDILFVEVLQVIFWFNPLFILIKKSIKLNHEFLADQGVLKQQFSIHNYIEVLLNYPRSSNQAVVSSPINYSLTKKRLQMMTTNFSRKRVVLKLLALIPMLLFSMLFFNNEIVANEIELPLDEQVDEEITIKAVPEKEPIVVIKDTNDPMAAPGTKTSVPDQDGVTKEMVKEYNNWAKDINARIKKDQQITMRKSTIDRMQYIYKNMTSAQRDKSEQFPDIDVPPPPPPPAPKVKEGERNDSPLPSPPKTGEIKEVKKGNLPSPPKPKEPSSTKGSYLDIRFSEKSNLTEEEKKAYIKEVEEKFEKERAEIERERANLEKERAALREEIESAREERIEEQEFTANLAMQTAERSRTSAEMAAMEAIQRAQMAKMRAEEQAQMTIKRAEEQARRMAMTAAEMNAENNRKHRKGIREVEKNARKTAAKVIEEARKAARKVQLQVTKDMKKAELHERAAMRKAAMSVRKAEMEAMKSARKAEIQAMRAERKASQMAENNAPDKLIERMAKKDADFYYNGKQISAKEALRLVEGEDTNFSIDASTKNGKSKVIIKD